MIIPTSILALAASGGLLGIMGVLLRRRANKEKITSSYMCLADPPLEKEETPKKPKTPEEKKKEEKAAAAAAAEAKSTHRMVMRGQKRILEYADEAEFKLCLTTVFYGHTEDGKNDVKLIASFGDESIGIFHATGNESEDAFFLFAKEDIKDLLILLDRQYHR